jgi:hypothetical protein
VSRTGQDASQGRHLPHKSEARLSFEKSENGWVLSLWVRFHASGWMLRDHQCLACRLLHVVWRHISSIEALEDVVIPSTLHPENTLAIDDRY